MSGTICAAFGCSNKYSKTKNLAPPVKYYKFPTRFPWEKERLARWINFCKRKNLNGTPWKPTKCAVLCSRHFVDNCKSDDPRKPNYNPTILRQKPTDLGKMDRYNRYTNRTSRAALRNPDELSMCTESPPQIENETAFLGIEVATQIDGDCMTVSYPLQLFISATANQEASTQVSHDTKLLLKKSTQETISTKEQMCGDNVRCAIFCRFASVQEKEKALTGLTSVSLQVFSMLLSILPDVRTAQNELQKTDRLLLFLIKLKTNLAFTALGALFGICPNSASKIFTTILVTLASCTKAWILWPSKQAVKATMPEAFKKEYPNCRVIIDCTEIKTEKPDGIEKQNYMYSSYKGSHTVKFLIGINPSGYICFISKGYGGRATDSFITNDCGILDKLEEGDLVLADKGFPNINVQNGTILVMPPFSKPGVPQFSESQMKETYKVAHVRIHVERSIQRLKIFNILSQRLTHDLFPH